DVNKLASKENAKGQKTSYRYDDAGRMTGFTDEAGEVSYTYDKNGNVLTVTEKTSDGEVRVITRTYDALNRVVTYKDADGNQIGYTYNTFGELSALTYPNGRTVTYEYDKSGRLVRMTDWNGKTTSYEYDANNRLVKTSRADGSTEYRTYDAAGHLTSLVDRTDKELISSYYYTYDAVGNITSIASEPPAETDAGGGSEAGSESVAVSVSETGSASKIAGNRSYGSLVNAVMEYDENNRLIQYNGEAVQYDKDGNMVYGPLEGKMATFTYDCRNRLTEVKDADGKLTKYIYDAENHRVGVIKNADSDSQVMIKYVVDSASGDLSQVLSEKRIYYQKESDDHEEIIYYFYGDNRLVSQVRYEGDGIADSKASKESNDSQKSDISQKLKDEPDAKENASSNDAAESDYRIYHFNHVGSTMAVTSLSGEVLNRFEYSAYGDLLSGSYDGTGLGSYGDVSFLYNGQYGVMSDDNGLYYMRARYYDISIKRFINQDVVTGSIGSSKSLNRYAYVEGNPISYLDPFGLCGQKNDIINSVNNIMNAVNKFIHNFDNMYNQLVKAVQDAREFDAVVAIGISLATNANAFMAGAAQIAVDMDGNMGLQIAFGAGIGGGISAQGSIYSAIYPGKKSIRDIEGFGTEAGGSAGEGFVGCLSMLFEGEGKALSPSGVMWGTGIGFEGTVGEGHVAMSQTFPTLSLGNIYTNRKDLIISKWDCVYRAWNYLYNRKR
ncbi:MAG: hypothetical protein IJ711_03890, partial [Lachnospiraceae bacterium]|nr:hypothetical protein [Lachnospiraceae bacterium]